MDKDAPQSAGFYDFVGWLDSHRKHVLLGVGIVAIVAIGVGLFVWRQGERRIEAEKKLSALSMPYNPLDPVEPGTGDALAKLAADYPGTQAGAKASVRAGTAYFAEGQYAKAREQFNAYLREYGNTPWVSEAFYGVAATLEAEGKTTEAIEQYKDFLTKYGNSPAADQARFSLARLYEQANQPQLALETLNKMVNPQQPTPAMQEAQMRIRQLMAKHPSLMPPAVTPAPGGQPQVVVPQGGGSSPQVIINPSQPTPGQPNPPTPTPVPVAPAPTPAPATPTPPAAPAAPVPGK